MFSKYFLISLIVLLITASMALADGNFNGFVLYPKVGASTCEWETGDQVVVYNKTTPEDKDYYNITCCFVPDEGYRHGIFETDDYPPGTYILEVKLNDESECMATLPGLEVTHGTGNQYRTLTVVPKNQGQDD